MQSILLLGDSLTQLGFESHWVSLLSHHYIRRADVVNRGLSGYNTAWVRTLLHDDARRCLLLPPHAHKPLFATLLLGSNDLSSEYQHVPLDAFCRHLRDIITGVLAHAAPRCGVFVLTPPPVDEDAWAAHQQRGHNRTFAATRVYRDAVVRVVHELQSSGLPDGAVTLVDLHSAVLRYGRDNNDGNNSNDDNNNSNDEAALRAMTYDAAAPWTRLFSDGLHLNAEGGALLFRELLRAMEGSPHAAQLRPESLPYLFTDVTVDDTITSV